MTSESLFKKPRIEAVDSLRGFAIMAIMLLHSIEHFNFYVFPSTDTQPDWLNTLDQGVWDTLFFLFGGKGYAIFAILFGFTFSLMLAKQVSKGQDFGYRYLWRLVLLAGFAFINGAFFPGEVLLLYSIVGIVLFIVRKWSDTAILVTAIILLLQPIEWGRFIHYLFDNNYTVPAKQSGQYWGFLKEAQMGDSFFNLVKANTLYGHKVGLYWAYEVGRLVQSAGLFVLGFWLGKKGLFNDSVQNTKVWKRILIVSAIAFVPFYFIEKNFQELFGLEIQRQTIFLAIDMYGNLAFSLVLVSSFMLLYKTNFFRKLAGGLRYCGRMSLSAYIIQSIVGGFVFFGYGLGLGPSVRFTVSLGIGIILFAMLFYFCKFWIKRYKQGPFEMLWHKLTWINISKR